VSISYGPGTPFERPDTILRRSKPKRPLDGFVDLICVPREARRNIMEDLRKHITEIRGLGALQVREPERTVKR